MATLQDVFLAHLDDYARGRRLHPREACAARAISGCYSSAFGSHLVGCPHGHVQHEQFHACRHRSCPRCAARPQRLWIDAQLQRLLPCAHFHAVFTLPHELLALWEYNRALMIRLLMRCVRECLMQMMADPRHLGATPGIVLSLHTWGRNLSHHPHVHALVSAGGLRADGQWLNTREGFLLPLQPLRKLFAGKLLAHLRTLLCRCELRLPDHLGPPHWHTVVSKLYHKHWNIQINAPYASGRSVTLYLARYAKGGPLPRQRTLLLHRGSVSFDYTDHRSHHRKCLTLPATEFIARVLWHAPPKGVHTTAHAGLYASALKRQHTRASIALATSPSPQQHALQPAPRLPPPAPQATCRVCGASLLRLPPPSAMSNGQISLLFGTRLHPPLPPPAHLVPTKRSNGLPTAKPAWPQPPPYHLAVAARPA